MNAVRKALRVGRRIMAVPKRGYHMAIGRLTGTPCPVCARLRVNQPRRILSDELVAAWELTVKWRAWFDDREGTYCPLCNSNRRSQFMAESIVRYVNESLGLSCNSLREVANHNTFHEWDVAELNACGQLHHWLAAHPRLAYSEYNATPPVRSENLLSLTYADQTFDLILTSETLEHVPDINRALAEIFRVLKPGGAHIFTVPVVWDRPNSRVCATMDQNGNMTSVRPPSFHGMAGTTANDMMVITEFGADIVDQLESAGFSVAIDRSDENPALCTFITRRF